MHHDDIMALDLFVPAVISGILLGIWVRYLLRVRVVPAILFSLAMNLVFGIWQLATGFSNEQYFSRRPDPARQTIINMAIFVAANLGIAMLVKIYRAAVLGIATPEEKSFGIVGIRAWLSPLNVVTAVAIWISACLGLEMNILGMFLVVASLLLAYPLINTLMRQAPTPTAPPQAPAEERQRVLALVEAGKITAEDGAELLGALAQSQTAQTEASAVMSGPRRMIVAGAAVVLVAFFLPWFTLNISQGMTDAMTSIRQSFPQFPVVSPNNLGQASGVFGESVPVPTQKALEVIVRAGDVHNGLGWITLVAGLGVAGLPFFWTPRAGQSSQQRNIILATLAVGTVALLYLLSNSFNSITSIEPGFFLAMGGYALLWFGAIREYSSAGRKLSRQLGDGLSPVIS